MHRRDPVGGARLENRVVAMKIGAGNINDSPCDEIAVAPRLFTPSDRRFLLHLACLQASGSYNAGHHGISAHHAANEIPVSEVGASTMNVPPEQEAIRAKCIHPSATFVEFPKEDVQTSIPARFEKIVRLHPDRMAVKIGGCSLTYDQLNRAANRIAHSILEKCESGNEPISVLLEHGLDAIVVILGALKANKPWLALDPSENIERLRRLTATAESAWVVANERNLSLARKLISGANRVIAISEIDDSISSINLNLNIAATSVANIYLTSGSTGEPKGLYQTHERVLHDARNQSNIAHITPDDKLSQLFSVCFSAGEVNWTRALLNGACLCFFDSKLGAIGDLIDWIKDEKLTICHFPVALFRQIAESIPKDEQLCDLRLIHLSGSPISQAVFELFKEKFRSDLLLQIHMGSTEAGGICGALVDRTFCYPHSGTPTGYPYAGKKVCILDDSGREVQPGRIGQIAVKSRFLARGYWKAANLTASSFIQDPKGGDEVMYLTGDLGHVSPDGMVIHEGRSDFIVKIRGYRVNTYEIERVLAAHPSIKESAVVSWDRGLQDVSLVGYVVLKNNSALAVEEVHNHLKQKLPEYMIPSAFEFVRALPLTASGKLDRKALPRPNGRRPDLSTSYAGARNEIEEALVNAWEEVLDVRPIGIHDSFFTLGGHSLAATRIATRINDQFELAIPLQRLFECPTIAAMAALIAAYKEGTQIGRYKAADKTGGLLLCPVARDGELPLSFAQQRMWLLNQLEPDSPVYNQLAALRLRGKLNGDALQKALDAIVERHEVLRTTFSFVAEKPVQVIHETGSIKLTVIDLMDVSIDRQEEALRRLLGDFSRQPFDLEKDWPLRVALVRWADERYVLAFVTHHIASDGWSNGILLRELSALYEAFSQGKGSPLKDLPIQYADYAVWQKEWLRGDILREQISYWAKQLKDISPLELPTDRPRTAVHGHQGRTRTFRFPKALARGLKDLSRQEGVTLFMNLLAAYQILLHRYTAQDDIVVACPIAGRTRPEVEGLIGFFVNTLVLRNDCSGNPTFREILARVKKNALDAYNHQDLPFEKLVEDLQPSREFGRNPFSQVMFQLRNYPTQSASMGDLECEEYEFESDIAKFELSVGLRDDETGLTGSMEYRTDLFDPATIERMIGHFLRLLESIVADPSQRISDLPLMSEVEKRQLLVEWNDTKSHHLKDKCIHELFEDQVEKTQDAIALVFAGQQLSYRELNQRANHLAHYLIQEGVQSGTTVGIYLDRSIELAVALLAVLKAGGIYAPVDPSCPSERATLILRDVQTCFVVSTRNLASRLSLIGARIITLDSELQMRDWDDHFNLGVAVESQSPAYILFTSGSTGTPKGVVMSHRALTNLISWQVHNFGQRLPKRTLQFAPLGFDVSIQEMFSTWCSGGSVYLISNDLRQDGAGLLKYIDKQSIERIFLPFVVLQNLADIALAVDCIPQSLHEVVTAGEQLRLTPSIRLFLGRLGHCRLSNQYGPTESHVATEYTLLPPFQREPDLPPIGRPIANTMVYILDSHSNPVPVGVTGELHIGGDGIALGYLNRPDLTAEKFITNPFDNEPGARLYRTGDLARYLPDGNIEFLGRVDNQVKIRGYRIEPGEIETVLAQHPDIQLAFVLARENTPGDRRLEAYLVANEGSNPSAHDLRSFLQRKLPEYMVPSLFMFIDKLPLTPNGKLDRKTLPAPDHGRPEQENAFTAPRTPVEEILARCWADVLQLDTVGVHDNFFQLGGHSLAAMRVVSRVVKQFQLEIPLQSLFQSPTVAAMAAVITAHQGKAPDEQGLATMLDELESLSEDDAEQLLGKRHQDISKA